LEKKKVLNPFPQKKYKKIQSQNIFLGLICDDNFSTSRQNFLSVRGLWHIGFWTFIFVHFQFAKKVLGKNN